MDYDILFSPINIGKVEIKNRIVMPPMLMGFGQLDGTPTEQMMNYYEERAKGGTGLIVTEITRVNDKTGASAFGQLSVSHDYHIAPLAEMAKRIQRHGAKFFVQLHHPGRQNVGLMVGTVPMSIEAEKLTKGIYGKILFKLTPKAGPTLIKNNIVPSSVAPSDCAPAYFAGGRVRPLRHSEIKELERQFIDGAARVKKAGCDGVMLHAAHGYLIQQFLSPVTNSRTDEYGGNFDNRMRFLLNILNGIKAECGKDFPVIVRLSADECYSFIGQAEKGYTLEDGVKIAKVLEENGADAIDVSSAGYDTFNYWLEPVSFEPGWRKYMAKAVKDAVSVPVLAANLIRSPEQAAQQILEGTQDMVCLGRPHIADPHWAIKVSKGEIVKRCICCLNCIESMQNNAYIGTHGECSVNPFIGHEGEKLEINGNGRNIVIIGAGPAGLMCAEILARRGFAVTVIEKNSKPGGQLLFAAAPPEKEKTAWFIEDAYNTDKALGVKFLFSTEATPELISSFNAVSVITATGSIPKKPNFDGVYNKEDVFTAAQILSGEKTIENKKIVIVGSGMTGLETAQMLCEKGCDITVIEMADEIAPGTWMQHKDDILPKLKKFGVKFLTGEKLSEIFYKGVYTENVKSGKITFTECDNVILSLGNKPENTLAKSLKEAGIDSVSIGDCNSVGKIADATKAAYLTAISI